MEETTWSKQRISNGRKLIVTIFIGSILLLLNFIFKKDYFLTAASIVFVISVWYAIITVFKAAEKISNS